MVGMPIRIKGVPLWSGIQVWKNFPKDLSRVPNFLKVYQVKV
jgi:hypothetical protein